MSLGAVVSMVLFNQNSKVREALVQVREELDEHLDAINENTGEIQSNYAYVQKIDARLDELFVRLDRIERLLDHRTPRSSVKPLTHGEKQVFLVLYTEEESLTYPEISRRTGYPEALVKHHINEIIEKGIPVVKSYFNSTPYLKLEPRFKELQAKENLVNLSLQSFVSE